jgi:hypothetical protein
MARLPHVGFDEADALTLSECFARIGTRRRCPRCARS